MKHYEVQEMKDNILMIMESVSESEEKDLSNALKYINQLENKLVKLGGRIRNQRVIKVQEVDMMGYPGDTKYFTSLKKAKRYFKKLFNRNKSDVVNADEGYSEKSVCYRNIKQNEKLKGRRYKEVWMECLDVSTSENGTEYGTKIITILLEEVEIEI